jgi:hypothetical protein
MGPSGSLIGPGAANPLGLLANAGDWVARSDTVPAGALIVAPVDPFP